MQAEPAAEDICMHSAERERAWPPGAGWIVGLGLGFGSGIIGGAGVVKIKKGNSYRVVPVVKGCFQTVEGGQRGLEVHGGQRGLEVKEVWNSG